MMALLLGLEHRTCYTTGLQILDESLQSDDLPAGYQNLCNLVRQGKLSDPRETIMAVEAAWSGVVSWAAQRNIQVSVGPWPFLEKDSA
jgi:kanamycin nucleotidyltransferase